MQQWGVLRRYGYRFAACGFAGFKTGRGLLMKGPLGICAAKPQAATAPNHSCDPRNFFAYGEFGLCPGCNGHPSYNFTNSNFCAGNPFLSGFASI